MNLSDEAIRKAAILVAALDTAAADALLETMDEQLATRVRAAYMELVDVDEAEQQRVIEQFMGGSPKREEPAAPITSAESSFTFDEVTLSTALPFNDYLNRPTNSTQLVPDRQHGFTFPEMASGDELAAVLCGEHPQTIAVVLANIEPARAGAALARLSPSQQADVARRIANLQHVDGEALTELQAALRESLGTRSTHSNIQASGHDVLQRIWDATTSDDKSALEQNLRLRDGSLLKTLVAASETPASTEPSAPLPAELRSEVVEVDRTKRLNAPAIPFDALVELDSASLSRVLQESERKTLLLALAGASSAFIEHVYRQLPKQRSQLLRRQIEQQGPIVLRDVAEAQRRVAQLASKLAATGEIQAPSTRRFAVAA